MRAAYRESFVKGAALVIHACLDLPSLAFAIHPDFAKEAGIKPGDQYRGCPILISKALVRGFDVWPAIAPKDVAARVSARARGAVVKPNGEETSR